MLGLLRVRQEPGVKQEWDASPEAIRTNAEWFFPYFEHVVRSISQATEQYVIEGVDFLPGQIVRLNPLYPQLRALFLGCSTMTVERFDRYPGHSPGYSRLPDALRRQIANDISRWSKFIRDECGHAGCAYLEMGHNFRAQVVEAQRILLDQDRRWRS